MWSLHFRGRSGSRSFVWAPELLTDASFLLHASFPVSVLSLCVWLWLINKYLVNKGLVPFFGLVLKKMWFEILVESESIITNQLKISRNRSKIQKTDSLDFCWGDIFDIFIEALDEKQRVKLLGPDNNSVLKCSKYFRLKGNRWTFMIYRRTNLWFSKTCKT